MDVASRLACPLVGNLRRARLMYVFHERRCYLKLPDDFSKPNALREGVEERPAQVERGKRSARDQKLGQLCDALIAYVVVAYIHERQCFALTMT